MEGKWTKRDYLKAYNAFVTGLDCREIMSRLSTLVEQDRVTTGAAFCVRHPYEFYGTKMFEEMQDKAAKAKDYLTYLSDRPLRDYEYYWNDITKNLAETVEFIIANEECAFEESQKQLLVAQKQIFVVPKSDEVEGGN